MKEEIDSRDAVFGMMMLASQDIGFSIFAKLKRNWFDIAYHQHLYDCAAALYAEGKPFDLMTVANYFNNNKLFSKHFTVAQLSGLTRGIGFADVITADSFIGNILFQFEHNQAIRLHQELGRVTLGGVFSVSDALNHARRFIDTIEQENVQENEENNADTIRRILTNHRKAATGSTPGINLGYRSLSEIIIEPVDLAVIAARPSMGKTAFIISVIRNMIFDLGYRVVLFSLEMSKEQIMRRLISNITGINATAIKMGRLTPEEEQTIESLTSRQELNNLIIYEDSHKPVDVIRKTAKANSDKPVTVVLLDYLQKMQKENARHSDFEHVSNCSNQMKQLAQNMKIPVIALSQLSRDSEKRGGDMRPRLSDLRSSGEIEQDASLVAFLHRPAYYGITQNEEGDDVSNIGEVIVAKYREGALNIIEMEVQPGTIRWQDKTLHTVIDYNAPSALQPNFEFDNKEPF